MTAAKPALPKALKAIIWLIFAEGLVVASLAAVLLADILLGNSRSVPTALALFGMVVAAGAFVIFISWSLRRSKRWARSAALFWQLIQLAIATGSFTGQFGNAAIGLGLIVPSLAVIVLIFRKDVVAATMAEGDKD